MRTAYDDQLLSKIKCRPALNEKEAGYVKTHLFDRHNVDIVNNPPEKFFRGLENFAAANTRWIFRNPMGQILSEVLYLYMVQHNVIITSKGIDTLCAGIVGRCQAFKNKNRLFTGKEGFLACYKSKAQGHMKMDQW